MKRPSPTSWPSRMATNGSSSGACPIRIDEKRGPDDEGGTFGPGPQLKRQWPHLPPQPADSTIELANRFQPKETASLQRGGRYGAVDKKRPRCNGAKVVRLTRASLGNVCSSAVPNRNGTPDASLTAAQLRGTIQRTAPPASPAQQSTLSMRQARARSRRRPKSWHGA